MLAGAANRTGQPFGSILDCPRATGHVRVGPVAVIRNESEHVDVVARINVEDLRLEVADLACTDSIRTAFNVIRDANIQWWPIQPRGF